VHQVPNRLDVHAHLLERIDQRRFCSTKFGFHLQPSLFLFALTNDETRISVQLCHQLGSRLALPLGHGMNLRWICPACTASVSGPDSWVFGLTYRWNCLPVC